MSVWVLLRGAEFFVGDEVLWGSETGGLAVLYGFGGRSVFRPAHPIKNNY